jgi:DNA-binding SARP family transcriptional activator
MDTRKALALLAYLVVTGTEQRRETLAALLWPEYDHTHAMGALRRTLSSLRKVLGKEHLVILRERVSIPSPPAFWSDYAEFNALLDVLKNHGHPPDQVCQECLEPLARAAELYRDHFMAGFSLRDSSEFDDWQFFQAEVLRQKYSEILERLSQAYVAAGDLSSAITAAQRWLAVDPLHEPAHRQLMQLFAWTGQRNASLRQYQECVKILDKELGSNLEETTLYHTIQENRYPVPALGKPATIPVIPASLVNGAVGLGGEIEDAPGEAGQFPLVGRNHEWSVIQNIYQRIQRDGHFVVLEGEPGIGKTRLAEEFLQTLSRSGAAVLHARCYLGESSLAYGPFVEILRGALDFVGRNGWPDHLPGQWLSEGARLLPELSTLRQDLPPVSPLESPGAQTRFFEGTSQILLAAAESTDRCDPYDMHWAGVSRPAHGLMRRTHGGRF